MDEANVNGLEHGNIISIKSSKIRRTLPQVLVSLVSTLLLLDIGLSIAYPTVLISALTGLNKENNPNELLEMTAVEASWMGSIGYLGKLVGSMTSGLVSEYFGRRNAMIFINFPHLISFYLFYNGTTMWEIFFAIILLGFGSGFVKAPSSTYIAESSEASKRGVLISLTSVAVTMGPVIVFSLGAITEWRNIALLWCVIQILTTIALLFIPESPMWLLSKQRNDDALKSLQWLRGWVPQSAVQSEFETIKCFKESSNSCKICKKANVKCTHSSKQTTVQGIKELIRKRTLKPFVILLLTGWLAFVSGTHHLTPYTVQILNAYRSPMSPNLATVIVSITGLSGTVAGIIGIKMLGKRKLYLIALSAVAALSLFLSFYGFKYLPPNSKSFGTKRLLPQVQSSAIPLIVFSSMRFFTTITLLVPFTLLSELFSMKSRSIATGVTTAMNNMMTFMAIKSFYNFEHWFDLPSALAIYGIIGVIGFVVIYFILPETEGRSLYDIEIHFSDNNRKITDRHIAKISSNTEDKTVTK